MSVKTKSSESENGIVLNKVSKSTNIPVQDYDDDNDDWDELELDFDPVCDDNGRPYKGKIQLCTCESMPDMCNRAKRKRKASMGTLSSDFRCDKSNFFHPCFQSKDVKVPFKSAKRDENMCLKLVPDRDHELTSLFPYHQTSVDDVYAVEKVVVMHRLRYQDQYLVYWKDYGFNEMTWENRSTLAKCALVQRKFSDHENVLKQLVLEKFDKDVLRLNFPGYNETYRLGHLTPPGLYAKIAEHHYNRAYKGTGRYRIVVENWTTTFAELNVNFIRSNILTKEALKAIKEADNYVIPKNRYAHLIDAVFQTSEKKPFLENKLKKAIDTPIGRCCPCSDCRVFECPCRSKYYKEAYMPSQYPNHFTECHKKCPCKENKVKLPMFGSNFCFLLFFTNEAGWSVRTLQKIEANAYVMEYIGIVCLSTETKHCQDASYLFDCTPPHSVYISQFDLANKSTDSPRAPKYVIDATNYGDVSRFINHSCKPNLYACTVQGHENDPLYLRVIFRSRHAIDVGEELTFSYFDSDINYNDISVTSPQCHCGADNCRRYLITTTGRDSHHSDIGVRIV